MNIFLDMDGTFADLYAVEGWLNDLENERTRPYEMAKPLVDMNALARALVKVQRAGHKIIILSALSKCGSDDFMNRIERAKLEWLSRYLPSVAFDEIHFVSYGTEKGVFSNDDNDILFDDEQRHLSSWKGIAYPASHLNHFIFIWDEIFN